MTNEAQAPKTTKFILCDRMTAINMLRDHGHSDDDARMMLTIARRGTPASALGATVAYTGEPGWDRMEVTW